MGPEAGIAVTLVGEAQALIALSLYIWHSRLVVSVSRVHDYVAFHPPCSPQSTALFLLSPGTNNFLLFPLIRCRMVEHERDEQARTVPRWLKHSRWVVVLGAVASISMQVPYSPPRAAGKVCYTSHKAIRA